MNNRSFHFRTFHQESAVANNQQQHLASLFKFHLQNVIMLIFSRWAVVMVTTSTPFCLCSLDIGRCGVSATGNVVATFTINMYVQICMGIHG